MFIIDSQTHNDLQIFPIHKNEVGIINIFKPKLKTYGGYCELVSMFRVPLTSRDEIDCRLQLIEHLCCVDVELEINKEVLDFIEHYMSSTKIPTRISYIDAFRRATSSWFVEDNEYYIIKRSLIFIAELLSELNSFAKRCEGSKSILLAKLASKILTIIGVDKRFSSMVNFKRSRMSICEIADFDNLIRYEERDNFRGLLDILYQLDVYTALVSIVKESNFSIPKSSDKKVGVSIEGLFHPLLNNPVDNDIQMSTENNICFITGANMSGKSTFMKAFGISCLLAHMGFPVPAREMVFSVFDGILTTINLNDNLALGHSHFYSEVQRIKCVAESMSEDKSLIIIFDELFRGTNVKDAHDGTIAIINAFAKRQNSLFFFSTHITEVAQHLKQLDAVVFKSFKSIFIENELSSTYKIDDGVSEDRLGMYIIEKEGLIELIENVNNPITLTYSKT